MFIFKNFGWLTVSSGPLQPGSGVTMGGGGAYPGAGRGGRQKSAIFFLIQKNKIKIK